MPRLISMRGELGEELVMSQRQMDSSSTRLSKIPVELSVHVCGQSISMDRFLDWTPGSVLTFDQRSASSLQLRVGEQNIATGRVVKLGSQLGFRIDAIGRRSQPTDSQ